MIIERSIYLNRIIRQLNRGMILVLVGQRRIGKSFLLRSLKEWIENNCPGANIVYIDKDHNDFNSIVTSADLYDYASALLPPGAENYLLVDEIQDIADYEIALRSLYTENRCQIVITGSNANLFSSQIATKLSGRYIEIPVYMLTYNEFLTFHNLTDCHEALLRYLQFGGLPGLANYKFDEVNEIKGYIQGVYNTVIVKDIIERESIRNIGLLNKLIEFLADNTGQLVSINGIVKFLKSQGQKLTYDIITRYMRAMCNALIIDEMQRFDIHGKRIFESIGKYYFGDTGIRNYISGQMPGMLGSVEKVMENIIHNQLLVSNFETFAGVLPYGEIDFVAQRGDERIYIQSCYKLGSSDTIEREFGRLAAIQDNFPKYVVTMEDIPGSFPEYPGIKHVHLRDFLKLEL